MNLSAVDRGRAAQAVNTMMLSLGCDEMRLRLVRSCGGYVRMCPVSLYPVFWGGRGWGEERID